MDVRCALSENVLTPFSAVLTVNTPFEWVQQTFKGENQIQNFWPPLKRTFEGRPVFCARADSSWQACITVTESPPCRSLQSLSSLPLFNSYIRRRSACRIHHMPWQGAESLAPFRRATLKYVEPRPEAPGAFRNWKIFLIRTQWLLKWLP